MLVFNSKIVDIKLFDLSFSLTSIFFKEKIIDQNKATTPNLL